VAMRHLGHQKGRALLHRHHRRHGEKMQKMTQKKDRRLVASRNPTQAAITCRPFTSGGATPAVDGVMRNFSEEGSYIEISHNYNPGTILHLRMVCYPPISFLVVSGEQPRSICLAEVRWRKELVDDDIIQYGLGLKYLV
jgi:hypothetical protein